MSWLLRHGGNGDVVVLRTSGSNGYNKWLIDLGAHSVESIVISSRAGADSAYISDRLNHAEVIFIAGGDQSTYLNLWKGTALARTVNERVNANGIPIGGTSAGLAVMGELIYSAQDASSTSSIALANPYDASLTFDRDLFSLPYLGNLITDTHFDTRDRMGRSVAFLARLQQDGWSTAPRLLAVDEGTAVGVERDGSASLFSDGGAAYFLTTTAGMTRICTAGTPLSFYPVAVHKMIAGSTFNLSAWSASGGTDYTVSAVNGALTSSNGGIY
jgi:cyanophycinase